jgi:hypothetical protein
MPLPASVKSLVARKQDAFLGKRVPPKVADKIRLAYAFRGNSVTITEHRAPWMGGSTEWTSHAVAKLRYNPRTGTWTLYWRDRNSRWHEYDRVPPVKDIDCILAEIDRDPTGIFWG